MGLWLFFCKVLREPYIPHVTHYYRRGLWMITKIVNSHGSFGSRD